jgi:hypothetical protein
MMKDLLSSGLAKEAVEELRVGLKKLDEIITDPNFEKNVKTFVDDVASIVEAIGSAVTILAGWLTSSSDQSKGLGPGFVPYDPKAPDDVGPGGAPTTGPQTPFMQWLNRQLSPSGDGASGGASGGSAGDLDYMMPAAFRPSSGASPALTGGRVDEAHDFFRAAGWSEAQTAGLLANLGAESGFDPGAKNATGHRGIAQWDANRQAQFRAMFGHDPGDGSRSDYEQQLWFVQWELTHTEKAAGDRLRAMGRDPGSSAAIVDRFYERSEGTTTGVRMNSAAQYMQQFKDRSVMVLIQNNTGGNANVTVTQLQT